MRFELTEDQVKKFNDFAWEHSKCFDRAGAIGGHLVISFANNGLGQCQWFTCQVCKKELNVTDYSDW